MTESDKPKPEPYTGPKGDFYNPDIVVAIEHLHLVKQVLDDPAHRVPTEEVDRSELLGLALLRLKAPEHSADQPLDEHAAATIIDRISDVTARKEAEAAATPLDKFFRGLRAYFAANYAGWIPTIGKNRLAGNVAGGGKISHGGGEKPEFVAKPRDLDGRPADPGRGVRVGVLDTPMTAHPWLDGGWVARSSDELSVDRAPRAVAGHATFVTGLVLYQAPGCIVEVRKVLAPENGEADAWAVATGIVELGRSGLDVLNLSLFCRTDDDREPLLLSTAIERLNPDTVVVAAAGNYGKETGADKPSRPTWPAALPHVIAVGSATSELRPAATTPQHVPWVDVLSTGENVVSTFLHGAVIPALPDDEWKTGRYDTSTQDFEGYARWSGSSFAAAKLTGAIAAKTVPGRVPARVAWAMLKQGAGVRHDPLTPLFLQLPGLDEPPDW